MRYQLKIFTLFFNKIYLFNSFLQFIWENVQDLKSHNPFIYKDFAKGFTKSVSSNLYLFLGMFFLNFPFFHFLLQLFVQLFIFFFLIQHSNQSTNYSKRVKYWPFLIWTSQIPAYSIIFFIFGTPFY